ncbi:Uncharacterised protein [Escherichia coli]|nr:Uncharacterised protein [Escherichia coli]SQW18776.1 Uncharacterised protein [Escherichia coli]SQW43691.1 Uncharacterised protein [Escherichia coli]SQW72300.1 Uncharacterised protein [Escherichia coli]SQW83355.1 Uncharacterised protein [Escherichia coli]
MDKKIPHPGSDAGTLLSVRIYKLSRLSVSICLYHFVLQLLLDQESRSITEEIRYRKSGQQERYSMIEWGEEIISG